MRRAVIPAAISFMLSCAPARGPLTTGQDLSEGVDPSRDRYLTETFLDIRSSGPALEAGAGCNLSDAGRAETRDAWVRIRSRSICGAGRLRIRGETSREAFHLAAVPMGRVRIDLGDLVPDFGIGLISSGRRFTYPFSSRHPFYRPGGIRGWTGFYGSFIRGASIRAAAGPVRLTLVTGRAARHGAGGVDYLDRRDVSGIRLDTVFGGIRTGVTAMDAGSRKGDRISGFDLTVASGSRTYMLEAAAVPSGSVSAAWGLTIDGRDIDCGMIGWSVPAGSDGFLASFPGLSAASGRSRSGASITFRGRFPRRTHVSAWGELRRSSDGGDRTIGRALRCETGIRWKRGAARCSWSSRTKESEALVPFPPGRDVDTDVSGGLALSFKWRPACFLALVMEIKRPCGDSGEGLLYASRASFAIRRLHSRLSVTAAAYRSHRGRARFSLYEPSGGGKYPWKTLYGNGNRLTLGIDTGMGGMKASLYLLWTQEGVMETAMRLSVAI